MIRHGSLQFAEYQHRSLFVAIASEAIGLAYGRDPRRRLSIKERQELFAAAGGRCQRCGTELDVTWHGAHLTAWALGGGTSLLNVEAWCARCNLAVGPGAAPDGEPIALREWQAKALDVVLDRIYQTGAATVHAAPGAGKTHLAGAVFRRLRDAGYVGRLVVIVPNAALVTQWKTALAAQRVHIDDQPRDSVYEHPETVGAAITYQSLPNAASAQRVRLQQVRTLVVLDEVHHVGEQAAWGRAVRTMVGDVADGEVHPLAVLNMTGTLFRSSDKRRISTVRYDTVVDDDGTRLLQAVADFSVPTVDLIGSSLRAPDLYVYGAHAELVDLRNETVIAGDIADLDRESRSAAIRASFESRDWTDGFAREAVRLLMAQQEAVGRDEPLKLLYVAANQVAARRAADAINRVAQDDFARLVVSDEPHALRTLRQAAAERRSCAIVAVRMVTEGFDCPAVSTIAYASNVVASLFVAQMMARAMRITETERRLGKMLPAQILIPDHAELRRAFASALVHQMHVLTDVATEARDGPAHVTTDGPRLSRFELRTLSAPNFRTATVLGEEDGDVPAQEYEEWRRELDDLGVPLTYVPRVAVAARRVRRFPRIYETAQTEQPIRTATDPRAVNLAHRDRLKKLAGWMQLHISHEPRYDTIAGFQAQANEEAAIPRGGRDHASAEQLSRAQAWMVARIFEHCEQHGEEPPPTVMDEL